MLNKLSLWSVILIHSDSVYSSAAKVYNQCIKISASENYYDEDQIYIALRTRSEYQISEEVCLIRTPWFSNHVCHSECGDTLVACAHNQFYCFSSFLVSLFLIIIRAAISIAV